MEGAPQHRNNIQDLLDKAQDEAIVDNKNFDEEKMKSLNDNYKIKGLYEGQICTVEAIKKSIENRNCEQFSINGGKVFCPSCSWNSRETNNPYWTEISDGDRLFLTELMSTH